MAIKSSGALAMSEIAAEFGDTGSNLALKNYYRGGIKVPNGPAANANIATSGALSMLSFYGAIAEMQVIITANTTNVNLLSLYTSLFGAPSSPVVARLTINSGVIVGGVGGPALTIGQFPSGSIIAIDNYGSIQGFGGAANSGTGGDAIKADYPNQTITINNKTGGTIYGGGGGAGKGGTGGTGGAGYYIAYAYFGNGNWASSPDQSCRSAPWTAHTSGVCLGGYSQSVDEGGNPVYACNGCYDPYAVYTSGGAGGGGGNGGVGRGYNQAPTAGVTGSSGAAGGTNAGAGGAGGTGGTGGEWGAFGAAGNTGNTGASGNNGSGSAGTAGTAGGSPGKYLIKGAYSVTLNNSGTVAGGLA